MNMVQSALNSVSPIMVSSAAAALSEGPEDTRQGIADALHVMFAALVSNASTKDGAIDLLSMIRNRALLGRRPSIGHYGLQSLGGLRREGAPIARSILGRRYSDAVNAIADHAHIGTAAARALLRFATPVALAEVRKVAKRCGFRPNGVVRLLQGQREALIDASPEAIVADILGPAPPEQTLPAWRLRRAKMMAAFPAALARIRTWFESPFDTTTPASPQGTAAIDERVQS